jgi:hypothetical protein
MSDPNFEQLLENSERLEVVPSETYGAISEAWHTLGEEEVKNWSPEFDEDGSEKTEKWNDQNDKRNMIITDGKTAVSIPLVKLKEMGWDFINGHLEGPSAQAKKKSIEWAYE